MGIPGDMGGHRTDDRKTARHRLWESPIPRLIGKFFWRSFPFAELLRRPLIYQLAGRHIQARLRAVAWL